MVISEFLKQEWVRQGDCMLESRRWAADANRQGVLGTSPAQWDVAVVLVINWTRFPRYVMTWNFTHEC
ncbi:hypothetical protein M413DRAFT_450099 [Hebeloma cylindrosporum]|uniref:Uncharacterized protein n=1 Tax=Hebeloma cylindrosporum TaxID=76867 RepID=A0A0C3BTL4_HEBCY|nr:hypothetical protein M413DRAFT_450099 [Hebeloma cylindrosporum h7]